MDVCTPLLEGESTGATNTNLTHIENDPVTGTYSRKIGGWKACPFIIGTEFCERLSFVGIYVNLVVYLTTRMHQGNATAAATTTTWSGTCYLTSFIGAFLADSYLGRYWTIGSLSIVYIFGMVLLTTSASLPSLAPPPCEPGKLNTACDQASTFQNACLYTALYLIAFGTGGIKPCVSAFGADQFDSANSTESFQMTSYFNWFYFSVNLGALLASTLLVYLQVYVGWGAGYGLSSLIMLIAIGTFFAGTPLYRNQAPGGSPFTRILQVLVAASLKRNVRVEETLLYETPDKESTIRGSRKLRHTEGLRCLDKAAVRVSAELENQPTAWRLCSVTQVEEVKTFIRILPIWTSTIFFYTAYAQATTTFIVQGLTMDSEVLPGFKVPAASLISFTTFTAIVLIALYDWYLIPFAAKFTGVRQGFTQTSRIAIGLHISTIAILVAAAVEWKRLKVAAEFQLLDNVDEPVPMSILWQVPQYVLIAFAEVFSIVGQLEFFYDQSPDAMRSLGSALGLSATALGNYLSTFLVSLCRGWITDNLNRGHLDYFFLFIAALNAANQVFFWRCSKAYRYKQASEE